MLFLGTIHSQSRRIVRDIVRKLAYDVPKINLNTLQVTIVSRPYDQLTITLR